MQTKNLQEYAVFNGQDERLVDEDNLDNLKDIEQIESGSSTKQTRNVRKSIEHFMERQRLRSELVDFDLYEEH
jgi:hypothetical protein